MGGGAVHQSGLFAWEEDGIQGIRVTGAEDVLHGLACLLGQGSHAAHGDDVGEQVALYLSLCK